MGEAAKHLLFECFEGVPRGMQVVMSFCMAGVALCDIPTWLDNATKMLKLDEVSHEMFVFLHLRCYVG